MLNIRELKLTFMPHLPNQHFKFEALEQRLEMSWRISILGIIIYDSEDGWFPQFQ
jgi:hypothetical protein